VKPINYLFYKLYRATEQSSVSEIPVYGGAAFLVMMIEFNLIFLNVFLAKMDVFPFVFKNIFQAGVYSFVFIAISFSIKKYY
jgi:hypothetical protein